MFDLFWVPNFIKIGHIATLRPNMPKFLISGQDPQFQISYLWLTNLTCSDCQISWHWDYISFLGPNFAGMMALIIIIIISLFKVEFTITFHDYKKLINVSLPMRPDTNSMTK